MTVLVDTHAHLHDAAFDADRPAVIARARAAGVAGFLTIGTDVGTSETAVALAAAEPDIYAAVGIHPHDARGADAAAIERIAYSSAFRHLLSSREQMHSAAPIARPSSVRTSTLASQRLIKLVERDRALWPYAAYRAALAAAVLAKLRRR